MQTLIDAAFVFLAASAGAVFFSMAIAILVFLRSITKDQGTK